MLQAQHKPPRDSESWPMTSARSCSFLRKYAVEITPVAGRRRLARIPVRIRIHRVRNLRGPPARVGAAIKVSLHRLTQRSDAAEGIDLPARIEGGRTAGDALHGQYFGDVAVGDGLQ